MTMIGQPGAPARLQIKLSPYSGGQLSGLIGIIGPKGAGKSSLAKAIKRQFNSPDMAARFRFAGPIKAMVKQLLLNAGVPSQKANQYVDGSRKEEEIHPFPVDGVTARELMQTLGTEWGREHVDEDLWMSLGLTRGREARGRGEFAMIDDVRFQNEAEAIRFHGGRIVRVYRDGYEWGEDSHSSEGGLASLVPDYAVENNGSLEDLNTTANTLLANINFERN